MLSYAPFWETLKQKNISTYTLREKLNVNANTVQRMKNNEYLTLRTVEDFCRILDCRIEDVVVYVPDEPNRLG